MSHKESGEDGYGLGARNTEPEQRRNAVQRRTKKTGVVLSWFLEVIFSKDLQQMLTLRDVELISRNRNVAAERV
jgi:hypothetical protein